jgi:hypothetical protein
MPNGRIVNGAGQAKGTVEGGMSLQNYRKNTGSAGASIKVTRVATPPAIEPQAQALSPVGYKPAGHTVQQESQTWKDVVIAADYPSEKKPSGGTIVSTGLDLAIVPASFPSRHSPSEL